MSARSSLILVGALLGAVLALPSTGSAATRLVACRANGTLHYEVTTPIKGYISWSVQGFGECLDSLGKRYEVTFQGADPWDGARIPSCPISRTSGWRLDVSLSLRDKRTGAVSAVEQTWVGLLRRGDATTYPIATPFGIVPYADPLFLAHSGYGAIFSRIGGRCPPHGNDRAFFAWEFPLTT